MHPLRHLAALAALLQLLAAVGSAQPLSRTVIYVTSWSQYRPSDCAMTAKDLPPLAADVVNYAFAFLTPDLAPRTYEWNDEQQYAELQALKARNPKLKTMLSIGGWTMNEIGSGFENLFSQACATKANRTKFIKSSMAFAKRYGFDGIDIDWEYPTREDRGGRPSDRTGFTALLREFRAAIKRSGQPFLLTIAAGAGPSGYQGLELDKIHRFLDWINIMTYDFHGAWDSATNFHTPWVNNAVQNWSIEDALRHFILVNKVPRRKIGLGFGAYGRSWTLENPAVNAVGAKAKGPGKAGRCTKEPGFYSYREIKEMIAAGGEVRVDRDAKAAYMVYGDQWVGFDTPETVMWKLQAARKWKLGGTMVWAQDLDDETFTLTRLIKQGPGPVVPCGNGVVGTGLCSNANLCCSSQGTCGATASACGGLCFGGPCLRTPITPVHVPEDPLATTPCGNGDVGTKQCPAYLGSNFCCSKWGYCGTTPDHCGANCVGGACSPVSKSSGARSAESRLRSALGVPLRARQ